MRTVLTVVVMTMLCASRCFASGDPVGLHAEIRDPAAEDACIAVALVNDGDHAVFPPRMLCEDPWHVLGLTFTRDGHAVAAGRRIDVFHTVTDGWRPAILRSHDSIRFRDGSERNVEVTGDPACIFLGRWGYGAFARGSYRYRVSIDYGTVQRHTIRSKIGGFTVP